MKKPIITFLICYLLGCSSLFAQSPDEKDVAHRVENLRKLMINPNKTALEELSAEDLSFGHSTGLIEDRTSFIETFVEGKTKFTSITLSNQTIKIVGDVAIVRHRLVGDNLNNNVPGKVDIIILLIWQNQKGQWKLLARQAAKIPIQIN